MSKLASQIEIESQIRQDLVMALDFAEQAPVEPQDQFTMQAIAILRYLLQDGNDGYKGSIDGFNPMPAPGNNWLATSATSFGGQFIDGPMVFQFTLAKNGGTWEREFSPVAGVKDFAEPSESSLLTDKEWDAIATLPSDPEEFESAVDDAMGAIADAFN
jgi:hypothetical protein